jgi:hypothetical protein
LATLETAIGDGLWEIGDLMRRLMFMGDGFIDEWDVGKQVFDNGQKLWLLIWSLPEAN